jgi:predicted RNase H-like HicB family nuclease
MVSIAYSYEEATHERATIILRCDEQQGAYIGQAPEIVGVEGSGSTYEEALASVLEAIRWWQEMSSRQPTPPIQPENDVSR